MASPLATIAVVDDDESVRAALGQLLRAAAYATVAYASAEAFLQSPASRCWSLPKSSLNMSNTTNWASKPPRPRALR